MTKGVVVESGDTVTSGESQHLHAVGRPSRRIAMRGTLEAPPALLQNTFGWAALYDYWEPEWGVAKRAPFVLCPDSGRVCTRLECFRSGCIKTTAATAIMDVVHELRDAMLAERDKT